MNLISGQANAHRGGPQTGTSDPPGDWPPAAAHVPGPREFFREWWKVIRGFGAPDLPHEDYTKAIPKKIAGSESLPRPSEPPTEELPRPAPLGPGPTPPKELLRPSFVQEVEEGLEDL